MDPVSIKNGTTITSSYFEVEYRPSEDKSNYALNTECDALLMDFANADIKRDNRSFTNLEEAIYTAYSKCNTPEEIENMGKFLSQVIEKGGVAAERFTKFVTLSELEMTGRDFAINGLKDIDNKKRKPVTKKGPNGIESEYSELRDRLSNSEDMYDNLLSMLVTDMMRADLYRDAINTRKAQNSFMSFYTKFKERGQLEKLEDVMLSMDYIGGYGYTFYEDYAKGILNGVEKKEEKNEQLSEESSISKSKEMLNQFKGKVSRLDRDLDEFRHKSFKADDDVVVLVERLNSLRDDLGTLKDVVDRQFIAKMDEHLDANIKYLSTMLEVMDETKSSSHGL